MAAVKNLMVRCGADFSGLTRATKKAQMSMGAMQKSVSALKGALSTLGVAIGGAALVAFGKSCIDAASDLQEVQNVVDVAFGSMSGRVNEFAKTAIESFGLSETAAKRYTGTMGAMLKSMGLSTAAAADMAMEITGLAGDIASFYNLSSEDAFTKIRSGISGETEPLKQLGINMSVANMEAYALSQGIKGSYNAMTQAEKAALRYNYLMSVTADAQGDFTRTSGSWANQTRILAERFNQLKVALGTGLIQALTPALRILNTIMARLVDLANTFNAVTAALFGKQTAAVSQNAETAESAADAQNDLAGGISAASKAAKNATASFDDLNVLQQNAAGGSGVAASIPSVSVDGFADSISAADEQAGKLETIMARIKEAASPLEGPINNLKAAFGNLKNKIVELWDNPKVQAVVAWFKERVAENCRDGIERLGAAIDLLADNLDFLSGFIELVDGLLSGDMEKAGRGAKRMFEELGDMAYHALVILLGKDGADAVTGFCKNTAVSIADWFNNNVKVWFTKEKWVQLWAVVKGAWESGWSAISEWWNNSAIGKWWIEHVSPWFTKEKWIEVMSGVKEGFKTTFKNAINTAIGLFNKLIGWINEKLHFSWDAITIAGKEIIPAGSVQLFTIPKITPLAKGGIADGATLSMIGEAGREAVLPLENNTGWMDQLAERIGGDIVIQATGEAGLMKYLNLKLSRESARRGRNLVIGGAY